MMILLRVALLMLAAAPLAAQTDSAERPAPAPSPPTHVLTHNFTAPSREFVRVKLEGGVRYRATLSRTDVRLEIRTVNGTRQIPADLETESVYLITAPVTDEYEIRILSDTEVQVGLTIDRVT